MRGLCALGVPAGLDGRLARDGVQQVVPQRLRRERLPGEQICGKLLQERHGVLLVHVARDLADEHVPVAEIGDLKAAFAQDLRVFQHSCRLFARQLRRDGSHQLLRHNRVLLGLELLKEDAFVRGVLVDEQDALALLCDQIAVKRLTDQAERLLRQVERQLLRLRRSGRRFFWDGRRFQFGLCGGLDRCDDRLRLRRRDGGGGFLNGRHRRFDRLWRPRRILHL